MLAPGGFLAGSLEKDTGAAGALFPGLPGMGPAASRPDPPEASYSRTLMTTRRFWARLSRVLLSWTGLASP